MADPYARLRLRAHETRAFANKTSEPEAKHILLEIADELSPWRPSMQRASPRLPSRGNC